MNHSYSTSGGPERRDWRTSARARWPLIAALLAALLVGAWAVARRGRAAVGGAARAEAAEAKGGEKAESATDSVVTLDSTSLGLVGIELETAGAGASEGLLANGTITYDANRASVVAPRAEGRVVSVQRDLGQQVARGDVLAILESADVGQTRGDLERARAGLDVARQNSEREKRLFEQSISSQKEMLEAEAAYRTAQADYNSAASKIRSLGAASGRGGRFGLVAPVAGTVVERNAMPGQIAGPTTNLFTVADVRHLWLTVDVYESDAGRVRQGAVAVVNPRGLVGETFRGRVTYAGGVVDTASRTMKVRVELDNAGLRLRPGMFAQVRIEAPPAAGGAAAAGPLLVPDVAVQDLNGRPVVFVPGRGPGQFVARTVTLGDRQGGRMVAVTAGLKRGERFVTKGAFQLKSELQKGSFGDDES